MKKPLEETVIPSRKIDTDTNTVPGHKIIFRLVFSHDPGDLLGPFTDSADELDQIM